jgi:hypothetical protein
LFDGYQTIEMTNPPKESKMDKFTIEIDLSNAAFDDAPMSELARILRKIADDLESGRVELTYDRRPIRDANGNTVGHFAGPWER